jgi:hypothetical protein
MNEEDEKIAHPGNGIRTSRTTAFRPFWQFAMGRITQNICDMECLAASPTARSFPNDCMPAQAT